MNALGPENNSYVRDICVKILFDIAASDACVGSDLSQLTQSAPGEIEVFENQR